MDGIGSTAGVRDLSQRRILAIDGHHILPVRPQRVEDTMAALSRSRRTFVVGLLLVAPLAARAQAPRALVGLVKDSAGHAVAAAEVRARGNILVARSDDSGR